MSIETLEKKFSVPGTARLSVSNIRGSVKVQPGENGEITVIASKHTNSRNAEHTRIELSQSDDGDVTVATRYDQHGFGFILKNHPCKVDYDLRVPEECALKLRGVSNSASIEGISGHMDIASVSGDIDLRAFAGDLKVRNVSGDIFGQDLSASAHLQVVSGDIKMTQVNFPTLRGKTVSGNIEIESPLGDGPYEFNTVSGDVKFIIPQLRGATIHSQTLSGKVRTSAPISGLEHSRNNYHVVLEGGGVDIAHKSVSGDFILVSMGDDGASQESSNHAAVKTGPESSSEILDRLANGDLSVDEAVLLIAENGPD
jgi:DUF4097 and DUF4098 domain-containing protein YvlB